MFEPTLYTSQLSPLSVVQHALALFKEKEISSSINLILDYLSFSPDSTFLSRILSYLYAEIYDYDKAFDWIDKALSLDPSNSVLSASFSITDYNNLLSPFIFLLLLESTPPVVWLTADLRLFTKATIKSTSLFNTYPAHKLSRLQKNLFLFFLHVLLLMPMIITELLRN